MICTINSNQEQQDLCKWYSWSPAKTACIISNRDPQAQRLSDYFSGFFLPRIQQMNDLSKINDLTNADRKHFSTISDYAWDWHQCQSNPPNWRVLQLQEPYSPILPGSRSRANQRFDTKDQRSWWDLLLTCDIVPLSAVASLRRRNDDINPANIASFLPMPRTTSLRHNSRWLQIQCKCMKASSSLHQHQEMMVLLSHLLHERHSQKQTQLWRRCEKFVALQLSMCNASSLDVPERQVRMTNGKGWRTNSMAIQTQGWSAVWGR